jgi:hypothetical protein
MSSFVRRTLLWLASRAVKAQDELAALGLDRPTNQPNKIHIRTKGKHGYELAQPQNALTSAGLLMEGRSAEALINSARMETNGQALRASRKPT